MLAAQKENFESVNTSVCLNSDMPTSLTAISGVSSSKESKKKKKWSMNPRNSGKRFKPQGVNAPMKKMK